MEYITPLNIILVIFSGILLVLMYLIRNLLLKNEKYEDVVQDQVNYLQNISKIIPSSLCLKFFKISSRIIFHPNKW